MIENSSPGFENKMQRYEISNRNKYNRSKISKVMFK